MISKLFYSVYPSYEVYYHLTLITCLDAIASGGNHASCSWGEPPLAALAPQDRAPSLKTLFTIASMPIAFCLKGISNVAHSS